MQISSRKRSSKLSLTVAAFCLSLNIACENKMFQPEPVAPPAMKTVPAVRLNYKYEADVLAPAVEDNRSEERNPEIQADFDNNHAVDELLERTITSPDKKHILAVYRNIADALDEYRLDMYSAEGAPRKKLTSDAMAVRFPETIVWSPDSASIAFVAAIRTVQNNLGTSTLPSVSNDNSNTSVGEITPEITKVATPSAPTGVFAFRTPQIYICGADGSGLKPVTENEGLIYFYYGWSPDSSMLAALATTAREWKILEITADSKNEMMIPLGRLRIVEKNGRERRLDDNMTAVQPVWSPDSSKVAAAFDTQIRIYDATGTNPTQAAIPLRNQLLISSQAYDRDQHRQAEASNSDANATAGSATPEQPLSTLPDEKQLVSYNPIVELLWPQNEMIYLKTAYLKRLKNAADNVTSFSRWHRLPLSIQVATPAK